MAKNNIGFTININARYNPHNRIILRDYRNYIKAVRKAGASRIVHAGHELDERKKKRLENMVNAVHDAGLKAILYTGVFGTEDLVKKPELEKWAQKDKDGNILGYNGAGSSAMMCPVSPYAVDYLLPRIEETAALDFDGIFIDIPWIMKGGCYCSNCDADRMQGMGNDRLVRFGLAEFTEGIRETFPKLRLAVNASAPGIYDHRWHGANIGNLNGLFDDYVTEWNPLRWGRSADDITRCISEAKKKAHGELYHATTLTDRSGRMYDEGRIASLFSAILDGGAKPWLGIACPEEQMKIVGKAWRYASENKKD